MCRPFELDPLPVRFLIDVNVVYIAVAAARRKSPLTPRGHQCAALGSTCTRCVLRAHGASLLAGHCRRHPETITRITKTTHNDDKCFIVFLPCKRVTIGHIQRVLSYPAGYTSSTGRSRVLGTACPTTQSSLRLHECPQMDHGIRQSLRAGHPPPDADQHG